MLKITVCLRWLDNFLLLTSTQVKIERVEPNFSPNVLPGIPLMVSAPIYEKHFLIAIFETNLITDCSVRVFHYKLTVLLESIDQKVLHNSIEVLLSTECFIRVHGIKLHIIV